MNTPCSMRLVAPNVEPYTFHQARRSTVTANSGGFIRANDIDIHYVQAG